jgi:hypothetical protein
MTDPTPALAADEEPLCEACCSHEGLCRKHAREILPRLAQPFKLWKLLGKKRQKKESRALSPEAERVRRRKERKRKRAQERLLIGITGGFTSSRPAA